MKKGCLISMVFLSTMFFHNCSTLQSVGPSTELVKDQVIFKSDLSDEHLKFIARRVFKREAKIKSCSCGDSTLKLLYFNKPKKAFKLYTAVTGLNNNGDSGVKGDLQFIATLTDSLNLLTNRTPQPDITKHLESDKKKTIIAILDSGLDLNYFPDRKFLFPHPGEIKCNSPTICGWNFVRDTNLIMDDHQKGHGTLVTMAITTTLDKTTARYQILPLKVADETGNLAYFDILCALSYLKKVQNHTDSKIKVINSSFGMFTQKSWTHFLFFNRRPSYTLSLLEKYLKDFEDQSVIVAAAGNEGKDTDKNLRTLHIPSGFPHTNILSVGGHTKDRTDGIILHSDSNYGVKSIDIAAPYNLKIDNHEAAGTSFGAAFISALMVQKIEESQIPDPKPERVIYEFLSNQSKHNNLSKYIKDAKFVEQPKK